MRLKGRPMSLWLDVARVTAGVNVVILLALGSVWARNYRQHGAQYTLGFLVVGAFLLVENVLWVYFYAVHPDFIRWFNVTGTDVQVGMVFLCGLEFVALAFLARLTWL
jgi:hypothetical protein